MKNAEQKQMRAIRSGILNGTVTPLRASADGRCTVLDVSGIKGVPDGYLALGWDSAFAGLMPPTRGAKKAEQLVFEDGAEYKIFKDGERAVILADGLSLLDARDLMYDVFGCEESEACDDWKAWFHSHAEKADLEEQREMLAGMTRHLHMAAVLGLGKLVIDLIDSGARVDEEMGCGNDATPLEMAALHCFDPLPMILLLHSRGARLTTRAKEALAERGRFLVMIEEKMFKKSRVSLEYL